MAREDTPGETTLRPFRRTDIRFAEQLRALAGWNQTARDWAGYLAFEPHGCFLAQRAGEMAGTATTIRYEGTRLGWIGMVLVHPAHRRFGVGTALLRAAIAYLHSYDVCSIKLDATPMGKKVYLPLGFLEEYDVLRYEGAVPVLGRTENNGIEPLAEPMLPEVTALDRTIFGAARPAVLKALSQRDPHLCYVARDASGVIGYLIAREGDSALQLGPWGARDPKTAERLLTVFFSQVPGRRVFFDVPRCNADATAKMLGPAFVVQRSFTRMYLGANDSPGVPAQVYGTSGAEKG